MDVIRLVETKILLVAEEILQRKLTGMEYFNNVPLFKGGSNLTRSALRKLNERCIV